MLTIDYIFCISGLMKFGFLGTLLVSIAYITVQIDPLERVLEEVKSILLIFVYFNFLLGNYIN